MNTELNILYEDSDITVVVKPAGVASQSTKGMGDDMVSLLKKHYGRDGAEPYIGVVHRLDTMVPGVMVYARSKSAAAALSSQSAAGLMTKRYTVIVKGTPNPLESRLTDYLIKEDGENISRTGRASDKGAKKAELIYKTVLKRYTEGERIARLDIELLTGRHHQIRVQLSHAGIPVFGDRRYGGDMSPLEERYKGQLGLAAVELAFTHPRTRKKMQYTHRPEGGLWELV